MIKIHKVCNKCGSLSNINYPDTTPGLLSIEFIDDSQTKKLDICGSCFISMFKAYAQIDNQHNIPQSKSGFEGIKFNRKR